MAARGARHQIGQDHPGHSTAFTAEIYAELDRQLRWDVIAEIGSQYNDL